MLHHDRGVLPEWGDRRAIRHMLDFLTPPRRIEWLKWLCRECSSGSVTTYVDQSNGSASSVYADALTLMWGSGLTVRKAGDRLDEMVRGRI